MASIIPPDYTTPTGQVRLTIGDDDADGAYVFSDEQIHAMLSMYRDNIKLTAAAFLDRIANDTILLYKVVRTDDLQVDGAKMAEAFRKQAAQLRAEDAVDALEDAFEVVYPWQSEYDSWNTLRGTSWVY
jgi:hypothetical protein